MYPMVPAPTPCETVTVTARCPVCDQPATWHGVRPPSGQGTDYDHIDCPNCEEQE